MVFQLDQVGQLLVVELEGDGCFAGAVSQFEVAFQTLSQYFLGLAKRLPISPRINWLLYDSPDINCFLLRGVSDGSN